MKELLRITNVHDDVCEVRAEVLDNDDCETLAAALLGGMMRDALLAKAITAAGAAYIRHASGKEGALERRPAPAKGNRKKYKS